MMFLHPEFIYLMLPLLLILFAMLLTQREIKEQFFSQEILERLQVDSDQLSSRVRNLFYFLMFLGMIIALAEPVIKQGEVRFASKEDTLYITIDLTMPDVEKRAEEIKKGLEVLGEVNVGLLAYESETYLLCAPTKDQNYLKSRLSELRQSHKKADVSKLLASLNLLGSADKKGQLLLFSENGRELRQLMPSGMFQIDVVSKAQETAERLLEYSLKKEELQRPIYFQLFMIPIGFAMLMFIIASSSFYRGEKYYVPAVMLCLYLGTPAPAVASLFDYEVLDAAQRDYELRAYTQSARAYEAYALSHESREAVYNAANGYYRSGAYERAVGLYRSIRFVEDEKNHDLYFNLGNALVRLSTPQALQEAADAYKKALHFKNDQETKENLLWVQKRLQLLRAANVQVMPSGIRADNVISPSSPKREDGEHLDDLTAIQKVYRLAEKYNRGHWVKVDARP